MKRLDLEHWIAHHPDSIHADSKALLDRCENDAKDHAHRDAWIHAKEIAQRSLRRFEHGFGHPASDTFVTREVCHDLARELKHHAPKPDAHGRGNAEWLSRSLLDALDSEARGMFLVWLGELAEKEEHSTWKEIVRFTNHRPRTLIREGHMTDQCDWDLDHTYPLVAARVVRMLIAEFETHAAFGLEGSNDTLNTH